MELIQFRKVERQKPVEGYDNMTQGCYVTQYRQRVLANQDGDDRNSIELIVLDEWTEWQDFTA